MTVFSLSAYRNRHYPAFAALDDSLTAEEIQEWVRWGDSRPTEAATISRPSGSVVDASFREARLGWLHPGRESRGLFERLRLLVEKVNAENFGFDLLGFAEPVQYTVYEAPSIGYEWHVDMIDAPNQLQRKLSLTIQLSDGAAYEGGDLELRDGAKVVKAPRAAGCLLAFPSWTLHRVTPVTRGQRRSLVAWIGGPRFR
jgi:PKHD-type hydroxylase